MEHSVVTNPDLATRIVQSLSSLFNDDKLADFNVIVEDSVFKCHRSILGACSSFFKALFLSDMKEKMENSVRLHDIEAWVFELTLKVLYTGENVVNEDNIVSIWQCAHRLQILFLVEHCEKFLISILSMENYAEYFRMATVLGSTIVLAGIHKFILKNFTEVKNDKLFLEFSAIQLKDIIQSDELEVTREDDVLALIYKWVDHSPNTESGFKSQNKTNNKDSGISDMPADTLKANAEALNVKPHPETQNDVTNSNGNVSEKPETDIVELHKSLQNRSSHLYTLLKASRSCLATPRYLQTLYQHRLTQSDERAKAVIFDALLYHVKGYHHGYFPPESLHRNTSEFEHVGVIVHDTGVVRALSLARNKLYSMPTCKEIKNKIKLALFDSTVYAVGQADDSTSKLCVLKESSWVSIAELPGLRYFLLSHKSFLYVFNASNGNVYRMNPNSFDKNPKKLEHPVGFTDMKFTMSFNDYILVFSKDSVGGKEETAVHVMNTLDETWHRHDNLDGPATKMASFQDGARFYVLQNNGHLWSLTTNDAQMMNFTFIQKIWEVKESLRGALLYKGKLFLYVMKPRVNPGSKLLSSLPGVYTSVHTWVRDGYASNFICTVMHKLDMVKK